MNKTVWKTDTIVVDGQEITVLFPIKNDQKTDMTQGKNEECPSTGALMTASN